METPATTAMCLLLMLTPATAATTEAAFHAVALPTRSFVAPDYNTGVVRVAAAHRHPRLLRPPPPPLRSSRIAEIPPTATTDDDDDYDARSLFDLLSDRTLYLDPSGGTCCRSGCSGCVWTNDDGSFMIDEFSSEEKNGGWIAPYAESDSGDNDVVRASSWSKLLFASDDDNDDDGEDDAKVVRKEQFRTRLTASSSSSSSRSSSEVSSIAVSALWDVLSPVPGAPSLGKTDIVRAIRGISGSDPAVGNAVPFEAFETAFRAAVAAANEDDGGDGDASSVVDYESMDKAELKALANERGMVRVPPMKKLMIEELRFYDAHGRQGKRHPTKHTLS